KLQVESLQRSQDDSRVVIIKAQVPEIAAAGSYDVIAHVELNGVREVATRFGGIQVDAPVKFTAIEPQWGPMVGGTKVTLYGEGFEPGNTVAEGLSIVVGSSPALSVDVLSSNKITFITPRGSPGLVNIHGKDSYGNTTNLTGAKGFGYGIRHLASTRAARSNLLDVYVDKETGVAFTASGYFHTNFSAEDSFSEAS